MRRWRSLGVLAAVVLGVMVAVGPPTRVRCDTTEGVITDWTFEIEIQTTCDIDTLWEVVRERFGLG